jgi:DegV family protein with EDD domain
VNDLGKIVLVTDSTADISATVREEFGIEMVPLKVHFGDETFLDAITIESAEFYEKLAQAEALPTTSQPSPVDFVDTYKRLAAEDPEIQIISIHLSSALSGTYQSAVLAQSLLNEKVDITIVDSKSASYGLGMLVVAAAKAAREGKSKEECLELVQSLRAAMKLYFLVDTLEFLQKGGRIGKAAALFGSLLNIKPILTVDDEGEVSSVEKIRGQRKAMAKIIELLQADFSGKEIDVMMAYSGSRAAADELSVMIKEKFTVNELGFTSLGPVIGTHIGPGAVAVFANPVTV